MAEILDLSWVYKCAYEQCECQVSSLQVEVAFAQTLTMQKKPKCSLTVVSTVAVLQILWYTLRVFTAKPFGTALE